MAETTDARWPTDWEHEYDQDYGYLLFGIGQEFKPDYEVSVTVPSNTDGTGPDLDGLLARLRLDPAEAERLRDDWHEARSALAGIADCLNSELRDAGVLDMEVDDGTDMRLIIRVLVDRLYQLRDWDVERLERERDEARAEAERLRAEVRRLRATLSDLRPEGERP